MKASVPLTDKEIYEGCRTPSDLSVFSVSSPEPSLGPCSSAREIYEGLQTPDWLELCQRSFDAGEDVEDEFPSSVTPRTIFAGVFGACFAGADRARRRIIIDASNEERPVRVTVPEVEGYAQYGLTAEYPRLAYDDIVRITNGFQSVFGREKYGIVYPGKLIDGTRVAVKMFSTRLTSSPEFCNEVQHWMKLRHKNLVSVVGNCLEGNRMGLVLEDMPCRNLARFVEGTDGNENSLSWVQRIQIALDIAQGLEFLHCGFTHPTIHGTIKMTNILLNERLEAKLTDFWSNEVLYMAEFYAHEKLRDEADDLHPAAFKGSKISRDLGNIDAFQFGRILWELITGQTGRTYWIAHNDYRKSNMLADPRLQGNYDANYAKSVLKIAIECRENKWITMSSVVNELKSCLELVGGES